MIKELLSLILIIYGLSLFSQTTVEIFQDDIMVFSFESIDSLDLHRKNQAFLEDAYLNGYLFARLQADSISENYQSYTFIPSGKVYLSQLDTGNAEADILKKLKLTGKKMQKQQLLSPENMVKWNEKIVSYYENNGFPFCRVSLNITEINDYSVCAEWDINKGIPIIFDSIILKGKYQPKESFVSNWLGIERGALYDERKILLINERIKMSDIASQSNPFSVFFSGDKAKIFLYLTKKKSSSFDGILGFAPDPDNPAKLLFNGDIFLKVYNSFNHGEKMILRWKNSGEGTQEVKISASYPFIAGLPLGLNGTLEIFKKDTSWVKSTQRYGITYYSGIRNESSLFIENNENRVIARSIYENANTLPSVADSRSLYTGINFSSLRADDIIVPKRGFSFIAELAFGKKEILKNEAADENLYDSLELENSVLRFQSDFAYFIPLIKSWHFMFKNQSALIKSNSLFENDAFLLGGLQTLRGFDEKSIAATQYSVFTGELRFFLEQRSYINLFCDMAWARVFESSIIREKKYLSTGAGISFSTKAGIFSIFYALGKEGHQNFNIKNGKVHFGIVTVF